MVSRSQISTTSITDEEKKLVEDQLKTLLKSKYFKSAKKMEFFLKYIVEKTIKGEETKLKQYTIGVEALLFESNFNPEENPAVRILGGRVRKRLKEYYDVYRDSDQIIISIPKGTYTPEFNKNSRIKSIENAQVSVGPTLALASFSDSTQAKDTNRLLLQMTDNIATKLSRFLFLQLLVFNPLSDKDQSHLIEEEMKSTYKAEYALLLFLQKSDSDDNHYNLIYRLNVVETGEILWSENYVINDQPIEEQDYKIGKIIATVADYLQGMMHTHWSRKLLANTSKIPCHQEVLVYFQNYIGHTDKNAFEKGFTSCLAALNRNSYDVVANILCATYCRHEYMFNYGVIESPLDKGRECAETALRLNPNSHEAHLIYGLILFCLKDYKHSVEELDLARKLCKNNVLIEFDIGFHFCKMDQWDKGLAMVDNAMSFSSTYPSYYHLVPFLDYYRKEKYELALHEAKKITTPGIIYGPVARCISSGKLEMLEEAEKELQLVLEKCPSFLEIGFEYMTRMFGSEMLAEKIWDGVLDLTNKLEITKN